MPANHKQPFLLRRSEPFGYQCNKCLKRSTFAFRSGRRDDVWKCGPCCTAELSRDTDCCWCGNDARQRTGEFSRFAYTDSIFMPHATCNACLLEIGTGKISQPNFEHNLTPREWDGIELELSPIDLAGALMLGRIAFE